MALAGALALCGFAGGRVPQRASGKGGKSDRSHSPFPLLVLQSTWVQNQLQGGLCDTKTWDSSPHQPGRKRNPVGRPHHGLGGQEGDKTKATM